MTIFRLSPLIKFTLLTLYLALTFPLPLLAQQTQAMDSTVWLWLGLALGFLALGGALSEQVMLDDVGIQVGYPRWVPQWLRPGWSLPWSEIAELNSRTTGQGGLVYYFVTHQRDRAYLLPMRIAGFAQLTRLVQEKTGIDTTDIKPLAQPWMYLILLGFALALVLIEMVTFWSFSPSS
ncbi:hypothetical protein [Synechocystis sp. LKSZ1]|uniref:hypothetical protein n=1 Tax=Synechocystis sp. LKSZ1 TaxID=3144951 RepID=UPI00336C1A8F